VDGLSAGTFHSIAAMCLRSNIHRLNKCGRTRDFTINDTEDNVSLVKEWCREQSEMSSGASLPSSSSPDTARQQVKHTMLPFTHTCTCCIGCLVSRWHRGTYDLSHCSLRHQSISCWKKSVCPMVAVSATFCIPAQKLSYSMANELGFIAGYTL
jgi:hypothetical protein